MIIKYEKIENICVVFDGCTNASSTKDEVHARCAVVVSANVTIYKIMQVTTERK